MKKNLPHTLGAFRVILILAVTGVFDNYYLGLISFALPQVQQKFHLTDREVGPVLGILRLGFIPAVFITALADFVGRKPFILFTNFMLILITFASAIVQSLTGFIIFQFLGFMFIAAEGSVAVVMIIEEAGNRLRGFSVSLLSGLSAIGTAAAALIFGLNSSFGLSFQSNYYYGIVPLCIVLLLRTRIKETRPFNASMNRGVTFGLGKHIKEWMVLLKSKAQRLLVISLVVLCFDACAAPSYILASKFLQEQQHFTPYQVSTLIIGSGFFATIGTFFICYLSDRVGRKKILVILMSLTILAITGFYNAGTSFLYVTWFLFIIVSSSTASLLATVGTELFPAAARASASGIRGMFSALGGVLGLVVEGALYHRTGTHAIAISLLTVFIAGSLLMLWKIPETAGKKLDEAD